MSCFDCENAIVTPPEPKTSSYDGCPAYVDGCKVGVDIYELEEKGMSLDEIACQCDKFDLILTREDYYD